MSMSTLEYKEGLDGKDCPWYPGPPSLSFSLEILHVLFWAER